MVFNWQAAPFERSGRLTAVGTVTEELRRLVARQIDEHGIVVWFDPESDYQDIAPLLTIDRVETVTYKDSFFQLRRAIEPLLGQSETPPRLLIYVPLDQSDSHDALIEAATSGVVLAPGANPWQRNTRLAVIARRVLKDVLGDAAADTIEKQVAAGKLTLTDLDRIAEQGKGVATGTVSLVFGSANPLDIALVFLSSDDKDEELMARAALPELGELLGATFDFVPGSTSASPRALRERLARQVLAVELASPKNEPLQAKQLPNGETHRLIREAPSGFANTPFGGSLPPAITGIVESVRPAGREACRATARAWRNRRDLRESYAGQAENAEEKLGLAGADLGLDQLSATEAFPGLEERLQAMVEGTMLADAREGLITIARDRQSSFWAEYLPEVQARWALIASAGQLILEADRVAQALKDTTLSAAVLLESYAGVDQPWCLLDSAQRVMERRSQAFDFDLGERHDSLEQLIVRARQRYYETASDLAERFARTYQAAGFSIPSALRQRAIFDRRVAPALEAGKTAYVLVDALRFEMAKELANNLSEWFEVTLAPALATLPTITEVGMAALLPGADGEVDLVPAAAGKLALTINGATLQDRKDRVGFLRSHCSAAVYDTKLEELAPLKRAARTGIESARLVLVTSREIDALCEGDNVALARRTMDDVLHELQRAFQTLAELGVETIVVTADHGFIFGDELGEDMKIDPPRGDTVDLHRRVWVGRGGAANPSYLRIKASDLGLGGDLEIAVPWSLAGFKVTGGARAYFHGGLSPQEAIVPVLVLRPLMPSRVASSQATNWGLQAGSKKISTRFFSVQVTGNAALLFAVAAPRVRLEVREKGRVPISQPVSASYGFDEATGDVNLAWKPDGAREMEPNTVTLLLEPAETKSTATVVLLDAITGRELAKLGPLDMVIAL